jgi:hypothetical protein
LAACILQKIANCGGYPFLLRFGDLRKEGQSEKACAQFLGGWQLSGSIPELLTHGRCV